MIFYWPEKYEKYLTQVLGDGWNCTVSITPPEIVEDLKKINAQLRQFEPNQRDLVHFV